MTPDERQKLMDTLITCDGAGKAAKQDALLKLIEAACRETAERMSLKLGPVLPRCEKCGHLYAGRFCHPCNPY